jgi:putative hydrolase of the HAD superfamily
MQNVIFDLGGVVLEWNPERILAGYYADPGVRAVMMSALFRHPDWLECDRGTLKEAEMLLRVADRTGRARDELEGLLAAVHHSLHAKADTVALLRRLAERGVALYCLSNMSAATFQYLRQRHSFWDVFHGIVISGDIGMMKPDREIFEYLLSRYGLSASQSMFIDDVAANVRGAQVAGLRAFRFESAAQCEKELDNFIATR